LDFYRACGLHVCHFEEVKYVSFSAARWVTASTGRVSISCKNTVTDHIMSVSLPYPACSAARYDIVMEFKIISCLLSYPYTATVSAIHHPISHRIMMTHSALCIPKNNRVLTVVKYAMVKDEPVAIGDGGHTHREQINIPCKQTLCYEQIVQI